ncbi:MAG: hypothetical protein JRC68_10175 [Deltaproteobacteria bacterium]|nr:hypothetical protein [Deltaproteobacteria bacterium]
MEFDVVVYTASQAKKETIGKTIIGMDGAAEAFKKLWPVDVCLTWTKIETVGNQIRNRFHIPKVRRAKKGLVFERLGDYSKARFVING